MSSVVFQSGFQATSFSVPYVSPISEGLQAGKAIFIQGAVSPQCDSFAVSLKSGESDGDDIAFQMKPVFSSNSLVLNSRQNGTWGNEEKLASPFKKGSSFDLIIAVNSDNYQVFLSGGEIGQFKHRIPLERVTVLDIRGQVTLTNVVFIGSWAGSNIFGQGGMIVQSQGGIMTCEQGPVEMSQTWSFGGEICSTTQTTNVIEYQTTLCPTVQSEFEFSILNPVQNPTLPYTGPVLGGLKAGMAMMLQGTVASNANQFAVNFKTGTSDKDNIAFHFNPQIKGKVLMNSFRDGKWGTEEYATINPFKTGEAFQMFIVAKPEGYVLYINGMEYYLFKHRIPLDKVSAVNIAGDVDLNILGFIENWSLPSQFTTTITSQTASLGPPMIQQELLLPLQNPALPYVGLISGGLRTGMAFYLKGVAGTKGDRFTTNFKTGTSENDDIAFHFNPKYNANVVMNSFRNGGWETEEFVPDNPFKMGEAFEIIIVIIPEGYQVYVNGKEYYLFKHRILLENVSALNIKGDVVVNIGGFIQTWSTSSFATKVQTTTSSLGFSRWSPSTILSELLNPVQNPALPYIGPITAGLKAGIALYLKGTVGTKGAGFFMNFKTGQSDKDDTAFHFNPRHDSDVVMNSYGSGGWAAEEFGPDNPFKAGEAFEMFIVIKPEGYQVHVNGKEYYLFNHRIPLEKVSALQIQGDLVVKLFGFIQNWNRLSFLRWGLSTIQSEFSLPIQNPSLPYVRPIPEGLKAGLALYFQGVAGTTGDRFEINFKTGQSDKDAYAFHFNPRYNSYVAMNTHSNGEWGTEEFGPDNPFKIGEAFDMFIVIKPEGYQVYVNGNEHYLFKHRIPLEKVSVITIGGHVTLNLIAFVQKWSTSIFATQVKRGFLRWTPSTIHSQLSLPVQTPALPYVGPISGGLKAGVALYLQGVVGSKGPGFFINFKTGQSDKDDIAFHFNPRHDSDVVMNSYGSGGWGAEEFGPDNPFKAGEAFEMFIVIKPEGYQVHVNGNEYYLFNHRIPLEKVSALQIQGDLVVKLFGFIQNWNRLSFLRWGLSTIQSEFSLPIQNPSLPYVRPIPEGLKAGLALYFQGVAGTTGDRFEINFKTGQSDKDDYAFHFNPRYNSYVAMNTHSNGEWGAEEFGPDNPFKIGEAFDMFIVIKPEGYQVYVNGNEHYLFKHRIPLEKVSVITIVGHVTLNLIAFVQKWSTSIFATQVKRGFLRWTPSTIHSQLSLPVQTPALPYVGPISGGLKAGVALYLQGVVGSKGPGFFINFKTGQSDKDDIAFHFNPRHDSDVVMNSYGSGGWGAEQFGPDNPFKAGEAFEMFIVIKPEGYQVHVNGNEYYLFNHRIPLEKVSALQIQGDLVVKLFGFIQNWNRLSFLRWGLSTIQSEFSLPIQNPSLPYVRPIPEGLKAGLALYFQGVAGTTGDRFEINFKTGQSDKDDYAFHFNPRYNSYVAMNTHSNGEWGAEEFGPDNPFKIGEAFDMFIVLKPEGYQVYVNGNEHYLFKHRIPLEKVSVITIGGHVTLNLIAFVQKWSTSIFATQVKRGFLRWTPSTIHSQLSLPVQTPALPYVGPISGGLKAGVALYLQGVVGSKGPGFFINFKTGQSDKDDIAFHFNPRHDSDVVMNSYGSGGWGAEEFGPDNPFKAVEAFEMFIVIKPEGYQVHVNGNEYYLFNHRIPLEKVSALQIQGDLVVKLFGFIQNWNRLSFLRWGLSTIQSEFSLPIQNPSLPYVRPIPEGLKAGLALYFQGVAGTTGDRFEINFKTGQSDKDDYAFHFNPRYNSYVAMNTHSNGEWGAEEFGPDNPFKIGEAFDMFIVIKPEGYQVYVNGNEHYLFKHRIPLEKVSVITIGGHVTLNLIAFVQKWSTSIFATQVKRGFLRWTPSTIHSQLSLPVQTPALPYVGPISGGLKAGVALYLQGVVGSKGPGFFINFKTGQSDKDDIAFHFNPRHDSDVVMNSYGSGGWGAEEFGPDNPFKAGEAFEMFIVIKPEGYQVHVNGNEYYLFNHRIPLEKVSALQIQGDLVVKLFGFIQNWNRLSFLRWGLSTIQSEFSLPIQNPSLPYVRPISEGLKAGLALYFQGVAGTTGDRFEINFKTGQSDKDDYAFHFNPRYNSYVAMNTHSNGEWGAEEFGPDNPFKIGEAFDMFIVIKPEGYQVYVNGNEHYLFKHRIPLEKVSVITIGGHVTLNLIAFVQKWSTSIFATQVKRGFLRWTPSTIHSQLSLPVQTPALPYVGPISGGLKAGVALYLQGVVGSKGPGFFINFKTGQSDKDDIAFHFNPRHDSDVVMNSYGSGGWGAEEFGPDNPFKAGEAFEMFIVIKPEGYQVHVNGNEYYLFNHRIPLEKVSALQIQGDLVVKLFGFIQNWNRLSFLRWGLSTIQSEFSLPIQNPSLPYVRPIPEGLKAGLALYFQGVAGTTGDRFEINFKTGQSDKDDYAFHFNPRYNSYVAMNTHSNGEWGAEEFGPDNPFKIGEAFDMFIVIKPDGYQVYVNGNEHYLFKHRIPLEKVSVITIVGHVTLNLIAFVQKWSTSIFATQVKRGFLRWTPSTIHSQLSLPVQTPALPYVGPISGGLKAGVALYLQGVVGSKGPGFFINFKTGQSDKDDIAFHFNPRHDSDVVMNSYGSGGWGAEEFGPDNPFKAGEAFEMFIVIKPEGYQVHVNGNEYYLFNHRIPLEKVSALQIQGDLVVKLFGFIQNWNRLSFLRWGLSTIQSEFSLPIQNPSLPYVRPIPEGLKAGLALYFQGVAGTTGDRFEINFKTGQSDKDDYAFHFNPRYNSYVAMNTHSNGEWGAEEFGPDNPFKIGEAFDMFIVIKPEGYQVYVNGNEHYLFKHRIPLEKVSVITIGGHVTLNLIAFVQKWSTSIFATQVKRGFLRWTPSTIHSQLSLPVQTPALPYVGPISGGLKAGVALYLQGVVGSKGPGFFINFKTGQSDKDDIAFHFNPRHDSDVVMNSYGSGGWGAEEFGPDNPFKAGEAFEMFIVIKPEGYQVHVNGNEYYLFNHRIPLEKVSALQIQGDLVVKLFGFIQNWNRLSFLRWGLSTIQSEFSLPIQNPSLPYVRPIPEGLKAGLALYFQGVAGTTGDRFEINFKTGQSDKDDYAFHFNPRYNSYVAMNTHSNGEWGAEEFGPDNPFKIGEAFDMFIVIKPDGYQVYVNGNEHYLFKHRIPLEKVSVITIVGHVTLNLIAFVQKWSTSIFATQVKRGFLRWTPSTIHSQLSLPVQTPALPYVGPISGGLKAGVALYLQGVVGSKGPGFFINFKTGQSDKDDIAFHFNPRHDSDVVMNSYGSGGWGAEEFGPDNPFKAGEAFEMFIVIKPEGYQVHVNGNEYYLFNHRIPLEKVSALQIQGDLVVKLFGFIQNWNRLSFLRWGLSTIQSEFSLPIQNPSLPYVRPIPEGLKAGLALYFQGVAGTTGDRFEINFKTGQSDKDDYAFHFNPRYNSYVAMNTHSNGEWGAEEFGPDNPFKIGEAFDMFIVIKPEGYQVYVNGNEHYLFKHRIPLEKVSVITIGGHVTLNLIAFVQKWSTSIFATQVKRGFLRWTPSTIHSQLSLPVQTPALPYVGPISGGLKAGVALYLQGVVGSKGPGFFINFKTGQSDKDDIAFHFNPRHDSDVVMNSYGSGGWGAEEFGPDNPFKAGEAFEMFIVIKPEGYQVHVNGNEYYLFNHRIPLEKVSALQIQGDLVVKLFGFIQNWNRLSFLRWGLSTIQSEFSLPIQNPSLPYVRPIPEGLKAGLALYFQGVAGTTGDRFEINFKTGQSDKDDYAFHFNPRYNSYVAMNTHSNGEWGAEEFGPDNPFKIGEAFDMFIVIKPDGYQVYVNGNEHYLFKHRIPLEKVSVITIVGHVTLNLIAFVQKWSTSIFATQVKRGFLRWTPSTIHSQLSLPVQTPALPYVGPISGGLKAGVALYLQGVVGSKGPGFFINFKTGQSDKDDIAFHFNPRHDSDVVMNSYGSGGWGAEEFGPDNPFKAGEAFEMFIVIKPEGYQVHVNGNEYYLFNHRIPLEKVSALQIQGDLVVKLFGFIQNWNRLSFLRWGLSTIQSEFSLPIQNPSLPYVRPIPEGLKAGLALYFQGVAGTTGDRFEINFKTGQSDKDDYAFHFNPRYNSYVAMNTHSNGEWGAEEFGPDNPFKIGEAFDMFIVIKPDGYQVYVNGNEHYLFKHRIPLEKVSVITIVGHVTLNLIAFVQKWSTSIFATQVKRGFLRWTPSTIHSQLSLPVQTPALPYVGPISGGLKAGVALYLQGVVGSKGPGFFINFKTGQSDKDDIAFHFNPRHDSDVVMNSYGSGGWGAEEFGPDNPFKAGEAFEMFIVIKPEGYQVHVNGNEYYLFNHRIPLEKVSALQIQGDLVVKLFGFIQNWNRLSFLRWGLSTIQSEFSLPIQNPSLPYVRPIPEGLKAGLALYFQGVAGTTGDRFEINFKTGQSDKDDYAFHFNPRYNSYVAMNTHSNGEWGAEEFGPDNPFKIGEAFDMFIVIKPDGYQVYVNGNEHYLFKHRIPLEKVSVITIVGHVTLNLIAFVQKWSTSIFATQVKRGFLRWTPSTIHSQLSLPVQTPALPYVGPISGGLKAGVALYLQGVVGSKGPGFFINFKTGQSDKDDIAFHFNPRHDSDVVMNSYGSGGWGAEEFGPDNPFKAGEAFEMFIVIKPEGYQVHVNGKEYYLFNHRIPLEKVSALQIQGDLDVKLLGFIQNWNRLSFLRWGLSTIQSEFSLPVQNPSLPYVRLIPEGLKAGLALYFQGVAGTTGDRFEINFKTGQSDKDDYAFHFNPRYNSYVAMNTHSNGEWGAEEFGPDNPFKIGEAFDMFIVIKPEGYQVYVNGNEHYLFKHRIPLEKVSVITIGGHVILNLFAFVQKWSTSSFFTQLSSFLRWSSSMTQSQLSFPVQNPALPYVGPISGGLKVGVALYLQGVVGSKGPGFSITFKTGQSDKDDIAFHFNARYNSNVVMNSCRNAEWEAEEFVSDNPFKMGEAFEMCIVIQTEGYQVYLNSNKIYLFKHRIPLERISVLNIAGDVVMNLCDLIQDWSTSSLGRKFLSLGSSQFELLSFQSDLLLPVQNPKIPYFGPISGGVKPGMSFFLQGVVASNAKRFEINFLIGPSENNDIAFHFNPRFDLKVAMNTRKKGKWQDEEQGSISCFKMGQAFELVIFFTSHGYKVHVNGQELFMFKHRIPLDKVAALAIYGDVSVGIFGFMMGKAGICVSPPTVHQTHRDMGGACIRPPGHHHGHHRGHHHGHHTQQGLPPHAHKHCQKK